MQPRPQVLLVFQYGVENEKTLGMSCARLEASMRRNRVIEPVNSTKLFHMHLRKEKEGLAISIKWSNRFLMEWQIQIFKLVGAWGAGQGALMQSLRKKRDWLSKPFS